MAPMSTNGSDNWMVRRAIVAPLSRILRWSIAADRRDGHRAREGAKGRSHQIGHQVHPPHQRRARGRRMDNLPGISP